MKLNLSRKGFTLVEIMIVVVIIGFLVMLAIPATVRMREKAQSSRFASDVRTFAQAFESYSLQNGVWPPNSGSGVVPTGMAGFMQTGNWTGRNSVGGRWNWDRSLNVTAGISTTNIHCHRRPDADHRCNDR